MFKSGGGAYLVRRGNGGHNRGKGQGGRKGQRLSKVYSGQDEVGEFEKVSPMCTRKQAELTIFAKSVRLVTSSVPEDPNADTMAKGWRSISSQVQDAANKPISAGSENAHSSSSSDDDESD